MSHTLDAAWAQRWLRLSAAVIAENRMALIELDRAIGDGDHGDRYASWRRMMSWL